MELAKIEPLTGGNIHVIIETVKESQNKFNYDPELKLFRLKKTLPLGTVFPFDFGFIPNTLGEDGDPLDVLLLMDQQAFPGCMVEARPVGILEATQKKGRERAIRNDRIIAVSATSVLYAPIKELKSLGRDMRREIEYFFVDYNKHEGKTFTPLRWGNAKKALALIAAAALQK